MSRKKQNNILLTIVAILALLIAPSDTNAQQFKPKSATESNNKRLVYDLFSQLFTADSVVEAEIPKVTVYNPDRKLQVFGWHPYWLGDSYLNYDYKMLTSVSYFACTMILEEGGTLYYEADAWNSMASETMTRLADEDTCNMLLTLRCDDENAIKKLLSSKEEIDYCVKFVSDLVTSRENVEGITVSFEAMPSHYQKEFSEFIELFKKSLSVYDKSLVVAVLPVGNSKYDIPTLNKYVDQFVMLGYNYYYKASPKAGPVAPLYSSSKWGDLSIQSSVNDYITRGIPKSKLIVTLPYYGAVWQIDTLKNGKVKYHFVEHLRINQIWEELENVDFKYDSISMSAYYEYTKNNKYYICYFDDQETLKMKFKWIQNQGLAGIGMWALGYDEGRSTLWTMLATNFQTLKNPGLEEVITESAETPPEIATGSPLAKEIRNLLGQHEIQMVIGITLLSFFGLGSFLALTSNSILSRLLILEMQTFLKVMGIFLGLVLLVFIVSKFVFHTSDYLVTHGFSKDSVSSEDIQGPLKRMALLGILIISALSWKVFLRLNKDVP